MDNVLKTTTVDNLIKALAPLKKDAVLYVDMGVIKVLTPEGEQAGYLDLLNTKYVGKPGKNLLAEYTKE